MTSATEAKVIELYGMGCQHEDVALGNITPGMLIERAAGGVQAHSTAGGPASTHFAVEFGMTGQTIDDLYEASDQVIFKTYYAGSGINALVSAGTAAIADRALLASDGAGGLRTAGLDEIAVAQALEAVDNSVGGTAVRIKVEVIPAQRTAAV